LVSSPTFFEPPPSSYFQWQKEHETELIESPPKEKVKVQIDLPIRDISDILKILEEYAYNDEMEYNIDLKALHNIREELEQLHQMIGMEKVKKSVLQQMIYFIQQLHLSSSNQVYPLCLISLDYKHTILSGPPGTGKTEMAKILGKMYSKLGILKNNIFKKVTRNDLVAGYLGQTAIKTKKVIDECLGGVLFLDEAYSLGLDDAYSKECVDTLCEAMSDHRDDLMVIIAGYEKELNETFFRINTGMQSRFMWKFVIDKYEPRELMDILVKKVVENGWSFSEEYLQEPEKQRIAWFRKNKDHFPNFGRDMEVLFSYMKISHAQRIFGKDWNLRKKITRDDLENGLNLLLENKQSLDSSSKDSKGLPMGMYI
jgi:SpoVK/Ycf46/Vps4 family AAA+-type ATPase